MIFYDQKSFESFQLCQKLKNLRVKHFYHTVLDERDLSIIEPFILHGFLSFYSWVRLPLLRSFCPDTQGRWPDTQGHCPDS